jgi:hypothetical protein
MTTLQDLPAIIKRAVRTGTNVHVIGVIGIGKTSVIEQTVEEIRKDKPHFGLWVLYTPSLSPIDFAVPMPDQTTGTLKMYHNEMLPNGFTTPELEGIVFLSERDNADPATNKALQKYINNESIGSLVKPKGVIVISDSNDISHRSGAVQQSLALLSRSRLISVSSDADVALNYFAEIGVNPYVQAYLSLRKEHVNTFEELLRQKGYGVCANQRAWERLGNSLDDADANSEKVSDAEIIGDVGEGVGREFIAFLHAAKVLVSYDEIVKDPAGADWPNKLSDVYAITAMLSATAQGQHMPAIRTYMERQGLEVQVLFLRLLLKSKGKHCEGCCRAKSYVEWVSRKEVQDAVR